ncbi:hypothetical protein LCGC14_0887500 [marine sediment metagenome]|uniref:Uncharacterized protein n=1 Tax=marine sediment metagenome TaxID=412755 RepID=A0A0F9PKW6_9ZZZZ|nr:MAG: hypothetical protein Lokiarch_07740 [Candidatus Lokiarchaeum sp. GC14_75]
MISSSNKNKSAVRCGICRVEIRDRAQIYQAGVNFGIVCIRCYKQFSSEDIELMANMFIAYGGYFGMLKDSRISTRNILEKLTTELGKQGDDVNFEQINIQLLHKVLLHGITPEQYTHELKKLVE